jgi:hypothetical protein
MTKKMLRKHAVAARYDVNPRTVDRWLCDPNLSFPAPIIIARSPLWDEDQLEAWERDRAKPGRLQTATADN